MKIPAEAKLIGLATFSIAIMWAESNPATFAAFGALLLIFVLLSRVPLQKLLSMLLPALPFIAAITLFQWAISGPGEASVSCIRILLLYIAGSAVTSTTSEPEFETAIERILYPAALLTRSKVNRDLAMMVRLAITFIPAIREEHDTIRLAQASRGVNFSGLQGMIKGEIYVLIPLISTLGSRADRIALAMKARCYGAEIKRR